jgi:hypothetical protein
MPIKVGYDSVHIYKEDAHRLNLAGPGRSATLLSVVNLYEAGNRADKAQVIARYLHGLGISPHQATAYDEDQWALAASVVNRNPPSPKCQGLIIGLLTPAPTRKS